MNIAAILSVGLLLARVSSETFHPVCAERQEPSPVNNTTTRNEVVPCWCTARVDASLKTSVRRCNVTISGIGIFCCGSLANSVTIGWGEDDDTVLTYLSWASAGEFSETHVYTAPGNKAFVIHASSQILTSSCGTTYRRYRKLTVKKC